MEEEMIERELPKPTNMTTLFVLFYEPDAKLIPGIIEEAKDKLQCYEKLVFVDDRDDKSFEIDFGEYECLDLGGHKGVYYARWYATMHCETPSMRFVDSDDNWYHGVNLHIDVMPDIQICSCALKGVDAPGSTETIDASPFFTCSLKDPSFITRRALAELYGRYGLWAFIWKTEFLRRIYDLYPVNENFFLHEDVMINTAALEQASTITLTPTPTVYYHYNGPSETNMDNSKVTFSDAEPNEEDELHEDTPTRIAYIQKLNKELGLKLFDSLLIDGKLY